MAGLLSRACMLFFSPLASATTLQFKQSPEPKNIWLYGLIFVLLFIFAVAFIYYYRRKFPIEVQNQIRINAHQKLNSKTSAMVIEYHEQQWLVVDNGHAVAMDKMKGQQHD